MLARLSAGAAGVYLGIDFSGGAGPWKARQSRPTVWVARLESGQGLRLADLRPVQDLPGEGAPFHRLVTLLRTGAFTAAGIDAPFCIPAKYLPPGGHAALLNRISALPPAPDRPFPLGAALLQLANITPSDPKKPYRDTEQLWIKRGINTRSTLWNGPRGGAPFGAACLTLLAQAGRPVWPWQHGPGLLVEAFPAAQLWQWRLPHKAYGKPEQSAARAQILAGLASYLEITAQQHQQMLNVADALDAVIAAFAGIAAAKHGALADHPADGLISVWVNE